MFVLYVLVLAEAVSHCPSYVQYRSTPYVGPPQQYSVQPPGSGTFYPGPGPGEYAAPYRESLNEYIHALDVIPTPISHLTEAMH